jgi:hypothetical protein
MPNPIFFALNYLSITAVADLLSTLNNSEISVTGAVTATLSTMHVASGTSADYTITLPTAIGNTGKLMGFRMASGLTKIVTLDANGTELIDGALTRPMWANEACLLLSDGSNWFKIAGKSIPMHAIIYATGAATLSYAVSTKMPLDGLWTVWPVTGPAAMSDTTNNRIKALRASKFLLTGSIYFNINDHHMLQPYRNGLTLGNMPNQATNTHLSMVPLVIDASVNDYFEIYGITLVAGGTTTYGATNDNATHLSVVEMPTW